MWTGGRPTPTGSTPSSARSGTRVVGVQYGTFRIYNIYFRKFFVNGPGGSGGARAQDAKKLGSQCLLEGVGDSFIPRPKLFLLEPAPGG